MRFVAVAGACPGIGKSTLCASLAGWLADAGLRVDHFEEDHVLSRPQFAQVGAEFTATGLVTSTMLVDATARYLADAAADGIDVVVADALIPYVASLLACGYTEQSINTALDDLRTRIATTPTLVVFLDGEAAAGLRRAAEREGPDWLHWYGTKLARYRLVGHEPAITELCDYLLHERAVTLRVLRRQPWSLVMVERAGEAPADAVFSAVGDAVAAFVGLPQQPRTNGRATPDST